MDKPFLQFGPFSLQNDGTLLRGTEWVRLPPKELAVLRLLVALPGQVVPLELLRKNAWKGIHVSDESLPRCISSLRAHLGIENCIQTVYKRGYRFQLAVKRVGENEDRGPLAEPLSGSHPPFEEEPGPMTVWRGRRPARLAILPFRAMQDVPEAVGHGVAEAVMLRLARERHPAIEVLAWDSVANMASLGLFARDVGAALHADVVLAGSVSALPCHFRVRAEMIQVSDHVQLWLEDFLISCDTEGLEEQVAERIGFRTQSMKPIRKCMDAAEIEASEDPAA